MTERADKSVLEQRPAFITPFDKFLIRIDTEPNLNRDSLQYELSYSRLTEAEKKILMGQVGEAVAFRTERTRVARFSDNLVRICGGIRRNELDNSLSFSGLTAEEKKRLMGLFEVVNRATIETSRVEKISRTLNEISSPRFRRQEIEGTLTYGGLSKEQKDGLVEQARAREVRMRGLMGAEIIQRQLGNIYSRVPTQANLETELTYSALTNKQKQELKDILKVVRASSDEFRAKLALSYTKGFGDLLSYVENYPILDEADVAKKEGMRKDVQLLVGQYNAAVQEFKVRTFLEAGQLADAARVISEMPNVSEADVLRIEGLNGLMSEVRRFGDRRRVFGIFAQREINFVQAFREIAALSFENEADQLLAKELFEVCVSLERGVNANKILATLAPANADIGKVLEQISGLPTRTPESVDLIKFLREQALIIRRSRNRVAILEKFPSTNASVLLKSLGALPEDDDDDISLKSELFEKFREFVRIRKELRSEDFKIVFESEVAELLQSLRDPDFEFDGLGRNIEAFRFVEGRYRRNLKALVETFREDPRTKDEMDLVVPKGRVVGSPAFKYMRRVGDLVRQRGLNEIEESYFRSTQDLMYVSPYLAAVALADAGVTSVYLQNHFEALSEKTLGKFRAGSYTPLVVVGTGPNGIITIGEIVRKNARLAKEMLVLDQGRQVGGPFAIPNGPAWELNSANAIGEALLPDVLEDYLKTVRAYGSPERWFPGERTLKNSDTRSGSINKLIDWLPDPDVLSTKRYPTNEELQIMLALHCSVSINYLALQTRLRKVEPNIPDRMFPGNKMLTIEYPTIGGWQTSLISTDNLIISSGLGEPTWGFSLEGTRAKNVIEASESQKGLPKASRTLDAFAGLADRTRIKPTQGLGETIVIYGVGNSADTLVEYLGRLFDGENPDVKKIKKIYIVATGAPSRRPRYRRIDDIRPRLGQGNLIELVSARVADFDFTSTDIPLEERQMYLFDAKGQKIADENGVPIVADNIIAASGFRPDLDKVFEEYLKPGQKFVDIVEPFYLPTNRRVSVADVLSADKSVLFVGTASNPRFTEEKLSQLPKLSRDALLRVGAENAVAIGFRGPDSQAAVNIFLTGREFKLKEIEPPKMEVIEIGRQQIGESRSFGFGNEFEGRRLGVADNADESLTLSAILSYQINLPESADKFLFKRDGEDFSGELQFQLSLNSESGDFELTPVVDAQNSDAPSDEFINFVLEKLKNEYFERYSLSLLNKKRGKKPVLNVNLGFKRGRVEVANTFVT